MAAGRVGAGDPAGAGDDARVDEEADAVDGLAERARADVALGELGVGGEVVVGERLGLGRQHLRLEPLQVDVAVAGHADGQRLAVPSGWRSMTTTFFSVSAAVQGRSARRRSARAFRRSTSVAIVGVSGRVVDDSPAGSVVERLVGRPATRTASTLAA